MNRKYGAKPTLFLGTRRLYTPHDDFLPPMTSENDLAMLDG